MLRRAVIAITLATAAAALVAAPVTASARSDGAARARTARAVTKIAIDIFGDSLTSQAANYLASDLQPFAAVLHPYDFGGTALCDWVYPHMTTTQSGIVTNSYPGAVMGLTAAHAPDVAILQFVGNRTTPCISTTPFSLTGFLDNYHYCLVAAINHLLAIGVRHVIVDAGPLSSPEAASQTALRELDRTVVARYHRPAVVYASGADDSVLAHGTFTRELPCLAVEVATGLCTGPVVSGVRTDVVRSSDGVHFCPVTRGVNGIIPAYCPTYSSGAYRFAWAFAQLIWSYDAATEPGAVPVISAVTPDVGPETGGAHVTVSGYDLASVRTVQFVELYVPYINGEPLPGGTPVTVVVTAGAPTSTSDSSFTVTEPSIVPSPTRGADDVFVRVITPTAESTIGLTSDEFYPQATTSAPLGREGGT